MKILVFFMTAALFTTAFQSTEAAARDHARVTNVLVLGDSLSDGFGLSRAEAYPALLSQKCTAVGYDVEIINASASGGTTAGGLQRLPKHLTRPIDVLVLELGSTTPSAACLLLRFAPISKR